MDDQTQKISYTKVIEIVGCRLRSQYNAKSCVEDIAELIEENLSHKIKMDINYDEEVEAFVDYGIMAIGEVAYRGNKYLIEIERGTFQGNVVLYTCIGAAEDYTYTDIKDPLYDLKIEIKNILETAFKDIYWQFDEHNNKICEELYSEVYSVENSFRQLIIEFMVKKYGYNWNNRLINKVLKEKIKKYSTWYTKNYSEFKNVYIDLFNLQTKDLIDLLKSLYEVGNMMPKINEILKKYSSLKESGLVVKGLDLIGDKIQQEINAQLKENNMWEMYFLKILDQDFESRWEVFGNMRNMVAHNKPICKQLYNDFKEEKVKIEDSFSQLKKFISTELDSNNKEKKDIQIGKWRYAQDEYEYLYRSEVGLEALPNDESDVWEEINQQEDSMNMLETIKEHVYLLEQITEELGGYLEEVKEGKISTIEEDIIKQLIQTKDEMTQEELMDRLEEFISRLMDKADNTHEDSELSFESKIIFFDLSDEELELQVRGDICIEAGHSDEISVVLLNNGQLVASGSIVKTYGEYSIGDCGEVMLEVEDGLYIDVDEIIRYLRIRQDKMEKKLELIGDLFNYQLIV